jgi:TonB-dependent starch-binding outer membrane protein SusC
MHSIVISKGIVKKKGIRRCYLFLALFALAQSSLSQTVSLSLKEESIEKAFSTIEAQSPFRFIYSKETIRIGKPVTIQLTKVSVQQALSAIFAGQPLSYSLEDNYVMVKAKEVKNTANLFEIRGRVIDENANPLQGVNVTVKISGITMATNTDGEFYIEQGAENSVLVFSYVGRETQEVALDRRSYLVVTLRSISRSLDETIIQAYGTTTRRLSTGNISKVSAEEISRQPVGNPLSSLEGRVPGLTIVQSNGLNGGPVKVLVRGQSSLLQGSEPLYVIDGIPFAPGNSRMNLLDNATKSGTASNEPTLGMSPLNLLNPQDIESIEVLKDADATAIYGSRGANGVILITTKKGKQGRTVVGINFNAGLSRVTHTLFMLNTQQYLQMRREAFSNDGRTLTVTSAPDVLLWDSTRFTDLKSLLIGGTAHTMDAQLSCSGGNKGTQFLITSSYRKATTVFPTDLAEERVSVLSNLTHTASSQKLSIQSSTIFSTGKNRLPVNDLTQYIRIPPHIKLYDSSGHLNWADGGVRFVDMGYSNPLSSLNQVYTGVFTNLNSNMDLIYHLLPGFLFKIKLGYGLLNGDETSTTPSSAIDNTSALLPYASFGNSTTNNWSAEPQAELSSKLLKGKLNFLAGATWQEETNKGILINGSNYSSDILLNSIVGAASVATNNFFSKYRYSAAFGRINYDWQKKYILNLSGRRDGSSRFGPQMRFNNFGAAGLAWIFSGESLVKRKVKFLSYGKIRASYGTTGNDQIGNYRFVDTWSGSAATYQNVTILNPTALFNPVLAWEQNQKKEMALDRGFLKDRFLISVAYFKNNSGNQLLQYNLPVQTGFQSITKNLDAEIQNTGWEIQLNSVNAKSKNLEWNSSFNLTIHHNKLVAFPGLASSSYASTYIIGQSVRTRSYYQYLGVNPVSGVYQFRDVDSNGTMSLADRSVLVDPTPKFYGGFSNTFQFKNFQFDVFFEFKKQIGSNYLNSLQLAGSAYNQPQIVLNRWQKTGQITEVQKFTSTTGLVSTAFSNLVNSSAIWSDASYIRCKNVAISYSLPDRLVRKMKMQSAKIYVHAQNLFVLTNYKGSDPETQNFYTLPPLKTMVFGIQMNF